MKPGMNVVIVDDVLTSGSSKQEALRMIKLRGGNPVAIMVIVDRTNGRIKQVDDIPIFSLTTLSDIERRWKEKQI
jgi:orotate phosphoribosyltransferase